MTLLRYRRFGIRYAQIWFNTCESIEKIDVHDVDILEFKESRVLVGDFLYPFKNGVIDLNRSLEEIHEHFDKGFSYEIRRAKKELINCRESSDLDEGNLGHVYAIYSRFCSSKQIAAISREFFFLYFNARALRISMATLDSNVLQYHIYFHSSDEIVLLGSFPGEDMQDIKRATVGFANRYLHWFDIEQAKREGKNIYNLGGIGNFADAESNGIVKFKKEMAPQVQSYYQGIVPVSLKGRLYYVAKKVIKKHV